jgi:hypothetical protein
MADGRRRTCTSQTKPRRRPSPVCSTAIAADGAAYIEVITDAYQAPPMYKKLHENVKSFYNIH